MTDFNFGKHAAKFRKHILASIPGYNDLEAKCLALSKRFVQADTVVYDVGCSTGHLLAAVRKANRSRSGCFYQGIDIEPEFSLHWGKRKGNNLAFAVADACGFEYRNASLILSLFMVQFIRPADKILVLDRMFRGLVKGGALIIAEKTLAETGRVQDTLTFPYYDQKRARGFSPEEILDKERALRGQMTLLTEGELRHALINVGFREVQPIWRNYAFVGYMALKAEVDGGVALQDRVQRKV